jgi:phytoene dehydrogenase-like protein
MAHSCGVPNAVVIGSGPNGLAGAITLAKAGFDVVVHEEQETIGGGLRTAELTLPGFKHDVCSAIHPLGRHSPFFREANLEVDWVHPQAPSAHPLDDGSALLLHRGVEATAASLGRDARAYVRLVAPILEHWEAVEPVLLGALPSPRQLARLGRALGPARTARRLRDALADARSFVERTFATDGARAFFAGHAAHSMLPMEMRPSAAFGLALIVFGHAYGWGFPKGGSQELTDALAKLLADHGGEIRTSSRVDTIPGADVVLADVVPRELLRLAGDRLPRRYVRALLRYRHGPGVFKLDWALDGPIPWRAEECKTAATVHLGGTFDEVSASERCPWEGRHADRPFVLLAQQTLFDETRAPAGKHTAWAYCHVPNGSRENMTERIEAQVERFAPGFRNLILARSERDPRRFESGNRNYRGGDINGGAMDIGQLLFRPVRKAVPYRTPLEGVYLCSSATPPGGGIHGMCGYAAAKTALRDRS